MLLVRLLDGGRAGQTEPVNAGLQDFDTNGETRMRGDETRLKQTKSINIITETVALPPPNDPGNRLICEPRFPPAGFSLFGARIELPIIFSDRRASVTRFRTLAIDRLRDGAVPALWRLHKNDGDAIRTLAQHRRNAMPRFAANLGYLFTERPLIERFGAAAAA